jgi:O-antigen/teichoic acid export membrane protein
MIAARSRRAGRGLLANTIALLATTQITALLGYLFWVICARGTSASTIGMANTVISAMTLVAIFAATGFEPLLTRVLPGASPEERSGLCGTALVVTAVVSGVGGLLGSLFLPNRVHAAVGTSWLLALLPAGSVATALLLVIGAALLGARRADLSLLANVVGSLLRLVAVAAFLSTGLLLTGGGPTPTHTVIVLWAASLIVTFALSAWLLVRATPGFRFRVGWSWFVQLRRGVAWDHTAMLASRLPALLLPIIASALFPAAEVGYATMALLISGPFFSVSASVSFSLLANCADRPERLRAQGRRAVRLIVVLLVVPVVVTCLLASRVLGLFGADYAQHSLLLILLLVAAIPDAVINLTVAILRVQRRLVAVAAVTVTGSTMIICGALVLMPYLGIAAAGWAAIGAPLILVAALAVILGLRRPSRGDTAGTLAGSPAAAADDSLPVAAFATPRDVQFPPPVVAFATPAEDSARDHARRSGPS